MIKRALCFFTAFIFIFGGITGRLFKLAVFPKEVSTQKSLRNRTVATVRGNIFDRNMTPLTNNSYTYLAIIRPTPEALKHLRGINEDKEITDKVLKGQLTFKETDNKSLYESCSDIKILKIRERYNSNSLVHILGYTNSEGNGVTGIEKYYNDYLKSTSGELSVIYTADAQNRLLLDEKTEIRDSNYYSQNGLILTIDITLQEILEAALIDNNILKGAGIILDNESGEILACASLPVYDRENLIASLDDENAPFINRAFSQYPVGSVFKVVTAACALENNISFPPYTCKGTITKTGNTFCCNKTEGHGEIELNEALSKSCNPYFIELGTVTGGEKLLKTAKSFHLGESISFGNDYMTDSGVLPDKSELQFDADVGNFAFGQGKFSATPLQIASIFATLGNKGIYNTPTLIKGTVDHTGKLTKNAKASGKRIINISTCNIINKALSYTVTEGTGKAASSKKVNSYSKTSTAQSGQYDKKGNEIKYCWFVSVFPSENPQYTVCIMKENGTAGGSDCGPAVRDIEEEMYSLGLFN